MALPTPQYITIVALREEDFQPVCLRGEKLFLDSNKLTPILKELQSKGYVQRQRDSSDKRRVLVSLTDEGRCLRKKPGAAGLGNSCGLTQVEVADTRKSLIKLGSNLAKSVHK